MEILSNIWMHKHLMLVVYENLDCSCLLFPPYMLWLHTFFIDWKPTVYKSALCHCLWTLVEEFNQKSLENGFYSFSFSDLRGTYFFVWIWATAERPYLLPEGLSLVFSFRVCLLRMKSGFFSFWQHLNFLFVHQVFILSFCCSVFKFIDSFFSSHDPLLILSVSVFVLLNFRKFFVSFFKKFFYLFLFLRSLRINPKAACMLGKCCPPELPPQFSDLSAVHLLLDDSNSLVITCSGPCASLQQQIAVFWGQVLDLKCSSPAFLCLLSLYLLFPVP